MVIAASRWSRGRGLLSAAPLALSNAIRRPLLAGDAAALHIVVPGGPGLTAGVYGPVVERQLREPVPGRHQIADGPPGTHQVTRGFLVTLRTVTDVTLSERCIRALSRASAGHA